MDASPNELSFLELHELITIREEKGETRVISRESSTREFKESFNWSSLEKYARTMAAFSNASGGYILFGIKDTPRIIVGLNGTASDSFDHLDKALFTQNLNDLFSPEIKWDSGLLIHQSMKLAYLRTYQSQDKPVVAKKSHNVARIQESDIFYRYTARTERIKYSELRRLLEESKRLEQRLLIRQFTELVSAGAANAAVLDFRSSTIIGRSGEKVLIDESLLEKISFIREGEFNERLGSPTLRIVGDLQPAKRIISPILENVVRVAISPEDILSGFLDQESVSIPLEYIKQICIGTTSYLPMHYYRHLADKSVAQLIEDVNVITTRSATKNKVLRRLNDNKSLRGAVPSESVEHPSTKSRRKYFNLLSECLDFNVTGLITSELDAQHCLFALAALPEKQIRESKAQLLELLNYCFQQFYHRSTSSADKVRRAACWMDQALYGE